METGYVQENRPRETLADSFSELANLALEELRNQGGNMCVVCGPITTGGRGSAEDNIAALKAVIAHLQDVGERVFDQTPYEATLWTLKDRWELAGHKGYCLPILTEFYLLLYQSGMITKAYFLPDWHSSTGAAWERRMLSELKIMITDFPLDLLTDLLTKGR